MKLAVVLGPVGSPSIVIYARRLAAALDYDGTIVVTTRGRAIGASGPRGIAETTRALRAARVGRIADPVERLSRAADVAAPPAPDLDRAGRRATLVLILVAALGGAWATAVGIGRDDRRTRRAAAEARARARVCADALRSHTLALARRPDLTPDARRHVESALGVYAEAISSLPEMHRADEVAAIAPRLRAALDDIAATTATVTGRPAASDLFAGLCGFDPSHGLAVASVDDRPACAGCRARADRGEHPSPRMLFEDDRPVAFDAAGYDAVLRPDRPS